MSRVLLRLRKGDQVRYLSHRDVIRAFEFALRRARIPVAYTEGFNPRTKMSFGSAVGVGVTSDDELIVLDLASPMPGNEVKDRLNAQLPGGIEVAVAEEIPEGMKSPISLINASEFRITISCPDECCSSIESAVREIRESSEVRVSRVREGQARETNIRPHLLKADVVECSGGTAVIDIGLKFGESGAASPRDFVQAVSDRVPNTQLERIHRLRQFHA